MALDHCADQYVLALAERSEIVAVTGRAATDYSYYAKRAEGLPTSRGTAEDILALRPTVVVRHWGADRGVGQILARLGIPMVEIGYGEDIATARANLLAVGESIGHAERAAALAADLDRRLAAVRARWRDVPLAARPRALYLTPSGTTSGSGTFVDAVLVAAGLRNMGATNGRKGWYSLDLEQLVSDPPDLIVASFYDNAASEVHHWNIARHGVVKTLFASRPVVFVPSRLLACSAWIFVDAIELIATAAAPSEPPLELGP